METPVHPLHEKLPDLKGKIVILSMTASGLESVVSTPVGNIHSHDLIAASLATMMTGGNITRPWWTDIADLALSGVGSLILTAVVLTFCLVFRCVTVTDRFSSAHSMVHLICSQSIVIW